MGDDLGRRGEASMIGISDLREKTPERPNHFRCVRTVQEGHVATSGTSKLVLTRQLRGFLATSTSARDIFVAYKLPTPKHFITGAQAD